MFDVYKMGEQIARLRKGNNYTQEQLAEKLKVSPQAVSKWENGNSAPEIPLLCEMAGLFNCSVDRILDPASCVLRNIDFNYEFVVKPRIPAADYSGPEWPKSISSASVLTALKLFYGLEQRRDSQNRQINDDEEYTDTIFAVGFSDKGRILKGLGFLEGDDQKNAKINFDMLDQYAAWYKTDCDMMIVKPSDKKMPLDAACKNALFKGIELLSNNDHCGEDKMQGYGMVIYRNWCGLLREENQRNAEQIECVFPHAFIHYENKLRTKQFFELCINIIPGIDKELMTLAIKQYNDIISSATEIATVAHTQGSVSRDSLKEKRNQMIEMLRRSSEQEELALSYIVKAAANI